jgi:hypothetical protein
VLRLSEKEREIRAQGAELATPAKEVGRSRADTRLSGQRWESRVTKPPQRLRPQQQVFGRSRVSEAEFESRSKGSAPSVTSPPVWSGSTTGRNAP